VVLVRVRTIGFCVVLCAAAPIASDSTAQTLHQKLSVRLGISISSLTGDVAQVYPASRATGAAALTYRLRQGAIRLRTGLGMIQRSGTRSTQDTLRSLGVVFTVPSEETLRTQWLEVPIVFERSLRERWDQRPYLGAGLLLHARTQLSRPDAADAPVGPARGFGFGAIIAAGLEMAKVKRGARAELSYSLGLRSLYDRGKGPSGSWQSVNVAAEVDLH